MPEVRASFRLRLHKNEHVLSGTARVTLRRAFAQGDSMTLLKEMAGMLELVKLRRGKVGASCLVPARRKQRAHVAYTIHDPDTGRNGTFRIFKTGRVWYWSGKCGRVIVRKKQASRLRKIINKTGLYTEFLGDN